MLKEKRELRETTMIIPKVTDLIWVDQIKASTSPLGSPRPGHLNF